MKETPNGEIWQQAAAYLVVVHGGAAMVTLIDVARRPLPLHIGRAWRAEKYRATGIVMLACNAVLIATAFGLYYLASEFFRPWASELHIAFGFSLPLLLLVHIKAGRKRGLLVLLSLDKVFIR